ncbi:MAG: FtsX-like permease family protein, partial [Paraclostridium sp.]
MAIGVCIFYTFNSLESQTIIIDLSKSQESYVKMITDVISVVSIFVSIILGFLVLYANNFIIKKRNKEFGIYMTLGISKNKISFMLLFETIIIGIVSLIVGVFVGVFLSQGLASITAKMFESDMTKYQFIFSKEACLKTILYFSLIFLIVMIFNFRVISKYKLIDLINSEKTNQKLKGTNLILSFGVFIISIICLGLSYKLILENKLFDISTPEFRQSIILGILGTILFFRALAGFLIKITQSSKNYYLKNLNTFTLRQLNSKINTHYISMSVICIMLFISIGMSSTGLGMKEAFEQTVENQTPYDMTISQVVDEKYNNKSLENILTDMNLNLRQYSKDIVNYNLYDDDISFKEMFKDTKDKMLKQQLDVMTDYNVPIMKISDYNKINKTIGNEALELKENEVVFLSDFSPMKNPMDDYISRNDTIKINNRKLTLKDEYEFKAVETVPLSVNALTLIVNDKDVENLDICKKYINLNYRGNKIVTDEKILESIDNIKYNTSDETIQYIIASSKIEAFEANMATANMFLYVGIYIGLVFLIASAAVLSLSQLSGAIESNERYNTLKKLGVSSSMINKSIFTQVLLYFALPIALALVHSVYGIRVANEFVQAFGKLDI